MCPRCYEEVGGVLYNVVPEIGQSDCSIACWHLHRRIINTLLGFAVGACTQIATSSNFCVKGHHCLGEAS